jgi:ribosomal protein S18 acetylase RimI-like enzyme
MHSPAPLTIREATDADSESLWHILEPMIRAGETYDLPRDLSRQDALAFWKAPGHAVFVALDEGAIVGTYFLRANHRGGGSHVANCGYVTDTSQTGRGIARAMCQHSLAEARRRGFRAMQFNFVVSTNERAVRLWHQLGFATVGRLPRAFVHPSRGEVDALVMYRNLDEPTPL